MVLRHWYISAILLLSGLMPVIGQQSIQNQSLPADEAKVMEHLSKRLHFGGGTPDEYLVAARYQIGLGTAEGFKTAQTLLEDAIATYNNNLKLIVNYADILYRHGFESEAIDQYEAAVDINEECWPAWYRLGEIYRHRMTRFRHEITSSGLSFEEYAAEYFEESDKAFQKCLTHHYGGDSLIVNIFWLYFDSDNLIPATKILDVYYKYQKFNAELYELGGLANVRIRAYDQAEDCYQKAFTLMSEEEKKPYLVSKNYLNARTQYLTTIQNIPFEDPLLLTEYNERELEHYARVTYAQKKFSVAHADAKGWQSDQGKILIRYGFPENQVIIRGEMEDELIDRAWEPGWEYMESQRYHDYNYWQQRNATIDEGGGVIRDTKKPIYWDFLTWYYPDFQISFEDELNNGQFQFAEKNEFDRRTISRSEKSHAFFAENLFNTTPERYTFNTKGGNVEVIQEVISNQLSGNKIEINFNYYFEPTHKEGIISPWKFALFRSRSESGVFRKFSEWQSDADNNNFWQRDTGILGQQQFKLYSGSYEWIFEGFNEETQEFFRQQFPDTVMDLNPRHLAMGEIQLGFYDPEVSGNLASLNEIPNASHSFNRREKMVIAFDVDGLDTLDRENALDIQYTITPVEEPLSIWETLGSIFVADEEVDLGVSVTNSYPVTERHHRIKQILDIRNLSISRYRLAVYVYESSTSKRRGRDIRFSVK